MRPSHVFFSEQIEFYSVHVVPIWYFPPWSFLKFMRGPGGRPGTFEPGPKMVTFRMVPKGSVLYFGYIAKNDHAENDQIGTTDL